MATSVLHHVDTPTRWDELTPNVVVRGWCVDTGGDTVRAVELVTAQRTCVGPVGLHRPDVATALGHIPGSEYSGFCFWFSPAELRAGRASFRARHRDGSVTELQLVQLGPAAGNPTVPRASD